MSLDGRSIDARGATPAPGSKRFGNIDVVRGLAALMVVFEHASEKAGIWGHPPLFLVSWFNFGQAGVVAFFLVSGFVIPLSLERSGHVGRFALNRVLRIYPLYCVVFALTLLIVRGDTGPRQIAAQLLFATQYLHLPSYVGNSWTLSIEAVWYVAFALLFAAGLNRANVLIVALFSAIVGGGIVLTLLGHRAPMGHLGMLATCALGLCAYRFFLEGRDRRFLAAGAVLGAAIGTGLYVGFGYVRYDGPVEFSLRAVAFSWIGAYALFFGSFFLRLPARLDLLLRKLGEISYSLYLVHTFGLFLMTRLGLSGWPYVVGVLAFSLPLSALTYSFIELPAIRLGHRWLRRDARAIAREPVPLSEETRQEAAGGS